MIVPLVMPTDSMTILRYGKKISRENAFQLLDFVQNSSDLMRYLAADSAQLILIPSRNEVGHVSDETPWPTAPYYSPRGKITQMQCIRHTGSGLVVVAGYIYKENAQQKSAC